MCAVWMRNRTFKIKLELDQKRMDTQVVRVSEQGQSQPRKDSEIHTMDPLPRPT